MRNFSIITVLLFFVSANVLVAQKVTYFNGYGNRVSKKHAEYYREIRKIEPTLWEIKEYYMSGAIKLSGYSSKKDGSIRQGNFVSYYNPADIKKANLIIDSLNNSPIKQTYTFVDNKKIGEGLHYYISGEIKRKSIYEEGKTLTVQNCYEKGQLEDEVFFSYSEVKGKIIMKVKSFYPGGELFRKAKYASPLGSVDYKLLEGTCFDENGNEIKYIPFIRMPEFPGGTKMLRKYIGFKVKYPHRARIGLKQGKVFVSFIVDKKGKVKNAKVVKSVYSDLDEEALRVVNEMPDWIAGVQYGKKVDVRYTVPINFRLK